MRINCWILTLLFLLPVNIRAEESNPFHIKGKEKLFGIVGDSLVATEMTLGFIDAYKKKELKCWAIKNGVGIGITEVLKRTITRNRPDNSDNKSFPSMHTMLGTIHAKGWRYNFSVTIAFSRMASNKHYFTDVSGGFVVGFLTSKIC